MGNNSRSIKKCNIAIEIEKSFEYGIFDAKKSEELFSIGYEATIERMTDIKKALKN